MGVLNRLIDMTKAAANELMDKLEDPAMMLNHYVRNMQGEIEAAQAELHKQEAMVRGFQQQSEEASRLADLYDAKALEAMTAGYEASAREALAAKLHYAEKSREYSTWLENAKSRIAELTHRIEEAKAELAVMQKKRDELITRVQRTAAKTHQPMPSFSCGFDEGSASRGFQRMEEKILQWEAHAELRRTPYGYNHASTPAAAGNVSGHAADPSKEALINEQLEQLRKRTPAAE
jgi:phage shock protein A